ncbi:hypothetical protein CR513_12863, partial [Mucuna pruriens]
MWVELESIKNNSSEEVWCLVGDFNSIRKLEERKVQVESTQAIRREMEDFNQFKWKIYHWWGEGTCDIGQTDTPKVEKTWKNIEVQGWVAYNMECFGDLKILSIELVVLINKLDLKDEEEGLIP